MCYQPYRLLSACYTVNREYWYSFFAGHTHCECCACDLTTSIVQLTYADFVLYIVLVRLSSGPPELSENFLEKFKLMSALKTNIESLPNVAAYIKERPETHF